MHLTTLYVGTCRPGHTKASWADWAGCRGRPGLAGNSGPGREVFSGTAQLNSTFHTFMLTFLRAEDLDISVLSVMHILHLNI